MKNKRSFSSIACFLIIFGVLISNGFAGLVDVGGSVVIEGTRTGPDASYLVQVDYSLYDGADLSDPLGATGDYQATFQLTHLGVGSTGVIENIGRFTVFTEATAPADGGPAYSYYPDAGFGFVDDPTITGEIAPLTAITDSTPITQEVEFWFADGGTFVPTLFENDVSQLLVVRFNEAPLDNLLIELDSPYGYGTEGATRISLIPEPATLLLLGSGAVLLRVRRKRHAA